MLYKRSRSHPRGGAGQESGAAVVSKLHTRWAWVFIIATLAIVLLSPRLGG